jgi:hypothetical protein
MTTRSGRVVKKPERYSPIEKVEDDFSDSELESNWESDISSEISYDPEDVVENEESDSDDADFVEDDSETEEVEEEEDSG